MAVILNFPNLIRTEGLDTSDATAKAEHILAGYTAYVQGQKIEGNMPSKDTEIYTPTTQNQEINSGQYLSGTQTILGDSELISDNIKRGVTIFGVEGNEYVINTEWHEPDTTMSSNNSEEGMVAFVNGIQVKGNVPVLSKEEVVITPTDEDQVIATQTEKVFIKKGLTVLGDRNLLPENIKSGVTIFNITGVYEGAVVEPELVSLLDCSGMAASETIANGSDDVVNAYSDIIQVSSDGSYSTFSNLENYVYDTVSAAYFYDLAGINIKSTNTSNIGFYFNTPLSCKTSHMLLKIISYVSTWITPTIKIHFIAADSVDEIPVKIANQDYSYTYTATLSESNNSIGVLYELTDVPVGEYYVFLDVPTATGGNEALINYLGFMNI